MERKRTYGFVAVMLGLLLLAAICTGIIGNTLNRDERSREAFKVTASFYPIYIAAMNLLEGIEGVELSSISEPETGCLHDYQLSPADMKAIGASDVLLINGGGIEPFMEDVYAEYPSLPVVDSSVYLENREADNAHFWTDIDSYILQVQALKDGLLLLLQSGAAADSEGAVRKLEENARSYCLKLDSLSREAEELSSSGGGRRVILFHEAFDYLAGELSLEVAGVCDMDEERAVSAGEVAGIISLIEDEGASAVLYDPVYGQELAETVNSEAPVALIPLDPMTRGEYSADSYLVAMGNNLKTIKAWLENGD